MPDVVAERRAVAALLDSRDESLVDLVDSLLDKGVVLQGEIVLGLADVDLIYVRLAAVVAAADRVFPPGDGPATASTARDPFSKDDED